MNINKALIINRLSEYYCNGNDAEFARKLGVTPQNLSNWKARNKIDYEIVYTKCVEINPEWLLTSKGPMLKEEKHLMAQESEVLYEIVKSKDELYERLLAEKDERIKDLQNTIEKLNEQIGIKDKRTVSSPKTTGHTT